MRETKFRAKSLQGDLVYFLLYEVTNYFPDDGVFYVGSIPFKVGSEQEYTGLKDKNGKESYHKDICKDDYGNLWVVDWSDEYAGFEFTLSKSKYKEFPKLNICRMIDMMEVIGNISESPELLEVK